jgi:very-short-patch-repair endonuclease
LDTLCDARSSAGQKEVINMAFCGCGCEQITTVLYGRSRRFISGHNSRTPEHRLMKHNLAIARQPFFLGKHHTEDAKKRMGEGHKKYAGKLNHRFGKKNTEEHNQKNRLRHLGIKMPDNVREILRLSRIGMPSPMKGNHHSDAAKEKLRISSTGKTNKGRIGQHASEKTRLKMRISLIARLKRIAGFTVRIGEHETKILDEIELRDHIVIDRQFEVIGYFVDGYCKETNTVYEVDEWHHFRTRKIKQSHGCRQKEIEKYLGCKFVRIQV